MKELELIIVEGAKAGSDGHHVEFGIPVRDAVEREGESFIVLSSRCYNLDEVDREIEVAVEKLKEVRAAAKANFRRWENEAKS